MAEAIFDGVLVLIIIGCFIMAVRDQNNWIIGGDDED